MQLSNSTLTDMTTTPPRVYEYEVYLLDETKQLDVKGEPILATDNLAVAGSYCYNYYNKFNIPIGVWQPRTGYFREHYAKWLVDKAVDPQQDWVDNLLNE